MDNVVDAFSKYDTLPVSMQKAEVREKFGLFEKENHDLIKRLTEHVREIELESKASGSVKSCRTVSSRQSKASSTGSARVEAAAEAAMLKAKLQHMEQKRAEFERAKTVRELKMAEAKLYHAISRMENLESVSDVTEIPRVQSLSPQENVERYLESEAMGPPNLSAGQTVVSTQVYGEVSSIRVHERSSLTGEAHQAASFKVSPAGANKQQQPDSDNAGVNTNSNVLAPEFVPGRTQHPVGATITPNHESHDFVNIVQALSEQVSLNRLPPPEPSVFMGDPLSYPVWKGSFHTLVGRKSIPPTEKIYYLKKYLGGAAKEAVEGYFLLSTENAFEEAMALLESRYGNQFVVAKAFRDKLDMWQKIPSRDGFALRKLADFLRQCNTALETIPSLSFLDDERENRKILEKLPEWLTLRWGRHASEWRERWQLFPSFGEFVYFITREANIACDPVTALSSRAGKSSELQKSTKFERKRYTGASSFSTSTEETKSKEKQSREPLCVLCEADHHLNDCKQFLRKLLEERKDFVMEKRLCFGCLRPGHRSKWCKHRKTCLVCSKRHPTSLHDEQMCDKPVETTKVFETRSVHRYPGKLDHGYKSSMIVPVWVSHRDNPEKEVMVYALLDTQSDTSFVLDDTCSDLGVDGQQVSLRLSTMGGRDQLITSRKVSNLVVRAHDNSEKISPPICYTRNIMPADRSHIPTPEMANQWPHLQDIATDLMPLSESKVGLLIGYNCPRALLPREVISSANDEPCAQKTDLGWGIVGIVTPLVSEDDPIGVSHRILTCEVPSNVGAVDGEGKNIEDKTVSISFRTSVKELIDPREITRMMELDFHERKTSEKALSQEDRKFLSIVSAGIYLREDGHYEMPLPFRELEPNLPNNRVLAAKRLHGLKKRFDADSTYRRDYTTFMEDVINKGLAEPVPEDDLVSDNGKVWYIPHHGVYHPKKPGKIRVVFDCSAQYEGQCLNDKLLQGPDLTNGLVGVLCRFRKEPIALVCDIQQMFYQFHVSREHQDFLRFLWWKDGDQMKQPTEYRMKVHLFGAASSPGCANFGLKQTANDNEALFGSEAAEFVRRDFYVDDGLKSVKTVKQAIALIHNSQRLCKNGGLKLHKFVSNNQEVLEKIPVEDRAPGLTSRKITDSSMILERALGVQWCIQSDAFKFRIILQDQPLTRRGILSTVSSVYDPLVFIAPVVLVGKQILQEMCREKADWDSPLPDSLRSRWEQWRESLPLLGSLEVKRCFMPENFGDVVSTELHHFSDASNEGYGQCSYVRLVDDKGQVSCSLAMGKARVTPLKPVTIPRLELTAAVVSVRVSNFLLEELEMGDVKEVFWCDSKVVLGYIANETKRFHVFVANRVQRIRESTDPTQWRYVKSEENLADDASRGLSAAEFLKNPRWVRGPEFLWEPTLTEPEPRQYVLSDADPEVKEVTVLATLSTDTDPVYGAFEERFRYFSNWYRLTRAIANCRRYVRILKAKICNKRHARSLEADFKLTTENLKAAEVFILQKAQETAFSSEVKLLRNKENLGSASSVNHLDPFMDKSGIMRVGGRLKKATLPTEHMFPAILPRKGHVTELIARHFHKRVHHQGRGLTINEIRSSGYWIIGCSSAVSTMINQCVECRRMRRPVEEQRMADLPDDRVTPAPPFTYCGVDIFGPWFIKERRTEMKRYGVLFTCMASRAIHIETVNSLTADAFISALRRFISIRGPVRQIRCDRGTNFVGAEHELRDAMLEMSTQVSEFCQRQQCDFVEWKMNVPSASHMGGVWECQIRTVRSVLAGLMRHCGSQLDDESLRTFMCEAAAIVNSRPLSVNDLNDPTSLEPLTPNHILTLKSKVVLPLPGDFQTADVYCRKRWRRVQYLANEFWQRWRKEYIQNLQTRPKWNRERRDLKVDDIVLIVDQNLPRCQWPLARVCEVFRSSDVRVRKVTADPTLDQKGQRTRQVGFLERPIQKLILVLPKSQD